MSTATVVLLLAVALAATASSTTVGAARHDRDRFEEVFDRQEADRVEALPGQPAEVGFQHFSVYVTVNETHGRALFYWFFEAMHDVSKKPLVLWLNGEANLLFLESPAGVGFSYTNTTDDLHRFGNELAAHDAYTFLVNWFERFPQFKGHDFYIAGESYAGHYVPQLAEKIVEKCWSWIGNAAIDEASDDRGMVDYAWDHAIISDELYAAINKDCNFFDVGQGSDFSHEDQSSGACNRAMDAFYGAFDDIDVYSLYTPSCTTKTNSSARAMQPRRLQRAPNKPHHGLRLRLRYNSYDPCLDNYAVEYLNRRDVQEALHANANGSVPHRWAACSDQLFDHWRDSPASTLPVIKKMGGAGLRVWVYSGDTDARLPVMSTRHALRKLGLRTVKQWREWFTSDQVSGYTVVYDGLTFVTIRGAGHMVPTVTLVQARRLFAHFLAGKELPPTPIVA